jgi:excinuclease ABC subunit A
MARRVALPPIRLRGVRQNNLKGFDLELPPHRLIVITGLSGSGKSSLAFDTLYAEGQRRYIETFSPYARQFFDRMDKPAVDEIENIPPAIALEQCNTVRTTRSTVGTMTEICDYMKVLWPHLAVLHCRGCGQPVRRDTPALVWEGVTDAAREHPGCEAVVTFDLALSGRVSLEESLHLVERQGYRRLWHEDRVERIEEWFERARTGAFKPARLTVVQDRIRLLPTARSRFLEACEQAYHFGQGRLTVRLVAPADAGPSAPGPVGSNLGILAVLPFSLGRHCPRCDIEYPEPSPARFSFNHPLGACPECKGFGRIITIDYRRAIPDPNRTLAEGAIRPWQTGLGRECQRDLLRMCRVLGIPTDVPFARLKPEWQAWILEGDPDYGKDEEHEWPRAWYGVRGYFRWLESKSYKMHVRVLLSRYRAYVPCPACGGTRFRPETLLYRLTGPLAGDRAGAGAATRRPEGAEGVRLPGLSLADFYALPVRDALALMTRLARSHRSRPHDPITVALEEVLSRLRYLDEVGLGYLTLDRPTRTLSGGETERVNLTACLGSMLVNTLFVLDEPSVGLHPRDTERLVRILARLRDAGNTVVVVEHEPGVIRAADHVVELGPGRGAEGGQVVFQGSYRQMLRSTRSLTGRYLSGRCHIPVPARRPVPVVSELATAGSSGAPLRVPEPWALADRPWTGADAGRVSWLTVRNATRHNLRDLTVSIPLRRFVCITGVSGSGKSTLVREVLVPALAARVPGAEGGRDRDWNPDGLDAESVPEPDELALADREGALLEGWEALCGWAWVDQSPLGRTPRSNPAVYTGAFEPLRELFAATPQARARGYRAYAFSFNSPLGRCERCRGAGFEKIEMQFLSDVFVRCPECLGRRYRPEILEIKLAPDGAAAWSVADLLEATVDEAIAWLERFPESSAPVRQALAALRLVQAVGLGYLRLGQPLNTLSGGESQRLKLVRHLAAVPGTEPAAAPDRSDHRTLLLLFDEPTTGLHFDDVRILLETFQQLVDRGHSLVVIEHNLEVIKCADWVIDLGPEAGAEGGRVVVTGPPEVVAACPESHTGRALREVLAAGSGGRRDAPALAAGGR